MTWPEEEEMFIPTDHWIISRCWYLKLCPYCHTKTKSGKPHGFCLANFKQWWLNRKTVQLRKERDAQEQKELESIYDELGVWFPTDDDLEEMQKEYNLDELNRQK